MSPSPDLQLAYRRYFPLIRAKSRRLLDDADEAQDVAQETFIRFWSANLPEDDPRRQLAWLYRTCTRLAIDRLRSKKRRPPAPETALEEVASSDAALAVEQRHELEHLVRRFPPDELEVALLSRLDRLTHPEIAEVLGISERTVRRILTRFDGRVAEVRAEVSRV